MSTTCERGEQRLLFVAGALDDAEGEDFLRHAAGCAICTEVIQAARELLGEEDAVERESNDASIARVRARLERQVHATPPAPAGATPSPGSRWLRPALAAGVAAALVGTGAWWAHQRAVAPLLASNRALRERVGELEAERKTLVVQSTDLHTRLDGARRSVDLLRSEGLIEVPMTGTAVSTEAKARILWHAATQRCYMSARGLPHLGSGRLYVMWVYPENGDPILVGSFDSDTAGDGYMYGELPKGTTGISRVVITDEPATIPETPTGEEHLVWSRAT